ncbi:MAG: hypothetical protein F4035_07880 [Acidimicrobiia bacterium]|nr:hypothetical protein [Acidimicrobiia bacterium]
MLRNRRALAAILSLSIVLAGCGGSTEEPTSAEVPETTAPTTTSAPTTTTTEPPPVDTATAEEAAEEAASTSGEPLDMAVHLREKTMHLWDVYNTHDPDALKIFYSDSYWEEEKESLRANMQPFINQNLTFTAEETSPPTEIAPGKWETKHTARFPGGLVNMVFIYEEFDGTWLLTFAKPQ